jgi:hypothetical protein
LLRSDHTLCGNGQKQRQDQVGKVLHWLHSLSCFYMHGMRAKTVKTSSRVSRLS